MTRAERDALVQDIDLVCWWHGAPPEEKEQIFELVRADVESGRACYTAMAQAVHRAIVFDRPSWCPSA